MINKPLKFRQQVKCNRCGYVWLTGEKLPKYCANCNSPYWNRERVFPVKEEQAEVHHVKENK